MREREPMRGVIAQNVLDVHEEFVSSRIVSGLATLLESAPEEQRDFLRAQAMAAGAIGFDRAGDRVFGGTLPSRVQVTRHSSTGLGLFSTIDGMPICFFGGVAFHPGRVHKADPGAPSYPDFPGTDDGSILYVIDTGWNGPGLTPGFAEPDSFPFCDADVVASHGPAIVDIACTIMHGSRWSDGVAAPTRVRLLEPRYFHDEGGLGAATLLPAIDENGIWRTIEVNGETKPAYVRAADERSVELALDHVLHEVNEAPDRDYVINMSLGTVVDEPLEPDREPFREFIHQLRILDERREASQLGSVTVVAAAGNHASDARMWPAAHREVVGVGSGTWESAGLTSSDAFELDEVLDLSEGEVALARRQRGNGASLQRLDARPVDVSLLKTTLGSARFRRHEFSGHGSWVDYFVDGEDVPVKIFHSKYSTNKSTSKPGDRESTWTGTSFAAPKIAAMIAQGELGNLVSMAKGSWSVSHEAWKPGNP